MPAAEPSHRESAPSAATEPEFEREPPPRHNELRKAERRLLLQELVNVRRLLEATPVHASDRPRVIRRLADDYAELGDMLARDRARAVAEARQLAESEPSAASAKRRRAATIGRRIQAARAHAVDLYQRLLAEHPGYCRFPRARRPSDRACGDEVLFNLAYEYTRAGEGERASEAYQRLTDGWPQSKYAARAFLALGEHYFGQASHRPRWSRARQAYEGAVAAAPRHDEQWAYAHYKLGHVEHNLGRHTQAVAHFRAVIELGMTEPRLPNAAELTAAARRDLIAVYALAGDPGHAFAVFTPISGDRTGGGEATLTMMRELGRTLMADGRFAAAIDLYRDLLARDEGARACDYQARVVEATLALRSADKPAVVSALEDLVAQLVAARAATFDADTKLACADATAALLIDTATTWHLEAVGSADSPGTGSTDTMDRAEQLYLMAERHFPHTAFSHLRFPRRAEDDWPTAASVRYAHAELLFASESWRGCARSFASAYDAEPEGRLAAAALLGAAECALLVVEEASSGHRRGRPQPLDDDAQDALAALEKYHCRVRPPEGDPEMRKRHNHLEVARAELGRAAGRDRDAAAAAGDQ